MSKKNMNNIDNLHENCELKEKYNIDELFSKANPVKGKYVKQIKKIAVFLDDDLIDEFPNSESVNKALRSLVSKNILK